MSVRQVPLRTVCTQDRASVKPGHGDELPYLGLEGIESDTSRFVEGVLSKTPEAPQANSFRFDERHVLYGKLRPYLNKVALPIASGKCSTEIIPLLPAPHCDRQYLSYFLRAPSTVQQIAERSAGARMPRADMEFVLSLPIPLPALDEQRRIVDLLSRAEGIVRLRRQAQQKAAALIPAIFVDMFGDPATNPKGWPRMALGDLIASGPTNGLYKHKSAYGSGTPILRIDAFYDGRVTDLAALKRVQVEPDEQRRFALAAGDIIVNRVNSPEYLGKSALVPKLLEPTVFESNMMRFSIDALHALPEFVIALLQDPSSRRHFLTNAKHAINQSSINQQDVKSLPVFVPPLGLQRQFAHRVAAVLAIEQQQQAATAKAEATFSALLARAFAVEEPQEQRDAESALA
jgi:type I restriction enzyme S subunit